MTTETTQHKRRKRLLLGAGAAVGTGALAVGGFLAATSTVSLTVDGETATVLTTADTVDNNLGDGVAEDAAGNTSLRAAIQEANALANSGSRSCAWRNASRASSFSFDVARSSSSGTGRSPRP